MKTLQGAYVHAWVWVDVGSFDAGRSAPESQQEIAARANAHRLHHVDGELEIDDDAEVSLSYEEG